jgi:hypothetical protein|uniref:Uncharacterized protein n=1 Tax=viral metagenome TaxID=1070528 RepID=A0A6C0DJH7_9ZZZZ
MIGWIIQVTFISILLIILVHHFIDYFKTMLTVPKIKNLATTSLHEKYENIFKLINNNNDLEITTNANANNNNNNHLKNEDELMKDELTNFIKTQLQPTTNL